MTPAGKHYIHQAHDSPEVLSLQVTILGSGSALPMKGRHPSAQLVSAESAGYLIDCGEGTQYILRDLKLGISKIRAICISHLHGDHYYGLFGLLDTMALTGRKTPLYLIAPENLRSILLEIGRATQTPPSFPVHFVGTSIADTGLNVYTDELISIETFPLDHGVHCTGFLFRTHRSERSMRKDKLFAGFPYEAIRMLKEGKDVYDARGRLLYPVSEYTTEPAPAKTYAYCSDTVYSPFLTGYLKGVSLLYHEATFGSELEAKAQARGHSTAAQAALMAAEAGAGRLLIGHFSSRYSDISPLLEEARSVFPETHYAEEGVTFQV